MNRKERRIAEQELNKMFDLMMGNPKYGICPICGKKYKDHGHNAMPFTNGRCCSECDKKYVWPYRNELHSLGIDYWTVKTPHVDVKKVHEYAMA